MDNRFYYNYGIRWTPEEKSREGVNCAMSQLEQFEEIESVKQASWEEKMAFYFRQFRLPEQERLDSFFLEKELGITEEDRIDYQQLCWERCSMSSAEKKKRIVKEVIAPAFKENGFSGGGQDWYRVLSDGYLIAHLKSSMYNGPSTGNRFQLQFSVCDADVPKSELKKKWIENQFAYISHVRLLPDQGILSPYVDGDGYRIDGYRFYLPIDMPVEELLTDIRHDFTEYIMPEVCGISCQKDFEDLRSRIKTEDTKDNMKVLGIMRSAVLSRAMPPEHTGIAKLQQAYGLRKEEILSHEEELHIICNNQGVLYEEIRVVLERALMP